MEVDRLSIRERPTGNPIMHQRWSTLLFMHWRVPEELLRPLIPNDLHIDMHDGAAWIGVTPFTIPEIRLAGLPALPVIGSTHEINVRTYVHHQGVPGVWFLSLDASNPLAVAGARVSFALPYFQALIKLEHRGEETRFKSVRAHPGAPRAVFEAQWRRGETLPESQPGSLDFFLTERYCLYASRGSRILRSRIHHATWPLCRATLTSCSSTMVESHGLPSPDGDPIVHAQAAPIDVGIWRISAVPSRPDHPA